MLLTNNWSVGRFLNLRITVGVCEVLQIPLKKIKKHLQNFVKLIVK